MRCERAKRRISDALDGALAGHRTVRLERHVRGCAACRAYRDALTRLQAGMKGLADPGLAPGAWEAFGRRLESRLAVPALSPVEGRRAPLFFRRKWAWAGASFLVLAFIGTYLAVLRPRGAHEPVFISLEDSLARVFGEIGSNSDLENSFNQQIVASIVEAVRPGDDEAPVTFGDNPLFWEGLSDGELAYIESELRKEQGHGGSS
jgi:anti-sigma factor RsiW